VRIKKGKRQRLRQKPPFVINNDIYEMLNDKNMKICGLLGKSSTSLLEKRHVGTLFDA